MKIDLRVFNHPLIRTPANFSRNNTGSWHNITTAHVCQPTSQHQSNELHVVRPVALLDRLVLLPSHFPPPSLSLSLSLPLSLSVPRTVRCPGLCRECQEGSTASAPPSAHKVPFQRISLWRKWASHTLLFFQLLKRLWQYLRPNFRNMYTVFNSYIYRIRKCGWT